MKEKQSEVLPVEQVETQNLNEANLTDDELYAKIQTEKLLKRKKTKKIVTLISLCSAMVLAIVLIVLAAVPVSMKPNCLKKGFDDVTLYAGNSSPEVLYQNDKDYDQFMKTYNKAFSQTYLSALFGGSLGAMKVEEPYTKVEDKTVLSTIKSVSGKSNLVRLRYNSERNFTTKNGKPYESKFSNKLWDGTLKFNEAYFVVNDTAGMQDTKIYVVATYPTYIDGEHGSVKCLVTVTVRADTNMIYEQLMQG